jgi:hypothetical protein
MATLAEQLKEAARRGRAMGHRGGTLGVSAEDVALARMQRGVTQPMDAMPPNEAISDVLAAGGRNVQGWDPYTYRISTPVRAPLLPEAMPGAWVPGNAPNAELEAERLAMPSTFTVNPDSGELTQMAGANAAFQPRIRVDSEEAQAALAMEAEEDARREAMLSLEQRTRPPLPTTKPTRTRPVVEVTQVGAPPELAGRLGGTPLPRPSAASSAMGQGEDMPSDTRTPEGLLAALEQARQRRLMSQLGRASDMAASAISGTAPSAEAYKGLAAESDIPVRNYLLTQQEAQRTAKSAEEARLKDPSSPASQRLREYLGRAFPGVYSPEELSQVTAADRDMVLDVGRFKAEAKRRAEDRAASEAAAIANREDTQAFQASESAKARAAQRALAAQRTEATDSPEEREARRIAAERRKLAERNVGGYEIDPANPPTSQGATKMAETVIARDELFGSLDRLEAMYKKLGSENVGANAGTMASEWMNITNKLRMVNDMGVPNGADYLMLGKQIEDPSTLNSITTSKARGLAQMRALREQVRRKVDATANAYKFKPVGAKPSGAIVAPDIDLASPAQVQMRAPNGNVGMVDEDGVDEAQRNGYTRV